MRKQLGKEINCRKTSTGGASTVELLQMQFLNGDPIHIANFLIIVKTYLDYYLKLTHAI